MTQYCHKDQNEKPAYVHYENILNHSSQAFHLIVILSGHCFIDFCSDFMFFSSFKKSNKNFKTKNLEKIIIN